MIAHRLSTIRNADEIVVIGEHGIEEQGTHAELMESCEEYREIAMSQLSEEELAGGGVR